jgi:hypothetical protein
MRNKIKKFKYCFSIFSEIVKDRVMKFSDTIDLSIGVAVGIGLKISVITSGIQPVFTGSEKEKDICQM